jgi:hypothetical protein
LQGAGRSFFAAAGAADIEVFQVFNPGNLRLQKVLFKRKSAGADKFGIKHVDGSQKDRMGDLSYRRNSL